MFRCFYPSDLNKMLVDLRPSKKNVLPGCYSAMIRTGKIKKSGRTKPIKTGGVEWEYKTIL